MLLVDIGHYESEQYTKNLIFDHLSKKLPNFAVALSQPQKQILLTTFKHGQKKEPTIEKN